MATVLRVKRRYDDEPLDALLIACKRKKTDSEELADEAGEETSLTAVVKFAGTLQDPNEDVGEHLVKTLTKDELKANYKNHIADPIDKARLKNKENSKKSRYKVVNCFRSLDTTNIEEFDDKGMTVIDVEDTSTENTYTDSTGYVYDLYYTQTEENIEADHYFSIHEFYDKLVIDTYNDEKVANNEESEDSNSESNWRNDYPDSEHSDHSENSITEEDMLAAVRRMRVDGDDSDLSSDNEDFVYAIDEADIDHFGYKYAKYKARVKAELADENGGDDDDDKDSDDDDYDDGVIITEITTDDELIITEITTDEEAVED